GLPRPAGQRNFREGPQPLGGRAAQLHAELERNPRSAAGTAGRHRRRGEGRARTDSTGAGCRRGGARHRADGRRRSAAGYRQAADGRDRPAGRGRGRPADVCRSRRRTHARADRRTRSRALQPGITLHTHPLLVVTLSSDSRPIIGRGPPLGATLFFLGIVSVVVMVLDHRGGYLETARLWMSAAANPIYAVVQTPGQVWRWITDSFADRSHLRTENAQLTEQLRVARTQMLRFESLNEENRRLRAIREASKGV